MLRTLRSKPKHVATALGSVGLLVVLALAVIGPPMAVGQATRTWVSGVGDDVNPCSRTAPCKTFAGAISKTAPGGEINCLDPGGFGAVTITKSMTIDCTGTLGGILASSTTGVIVNGAGAIVTLRGLEINGGPPNLPGVNGVRILQAAAVHIIDTTIYNFLAAAPNGNGIIINNTSTIIEVEVDNSYIHNNGQSGILNKPSGTGGSRLTVTDSTISNNGADGIMNNATTTTGLMKATISNTASVDNSADGFVAFTAGTSVEVMISDSTSFNNLRGIVASGTGALVRFTRCSVSGNTTGVQQVGAGSALSLVTNAVEGNTTNGTFGTTPQK